MALTTILPSGLNSANDFSSLVPAAYSQANASFLQANAAFIQANASYTAQNTTALFANGAFITANTTYNWGNHASAGYATTIYVSGEIANLVNSSPVTLDTLNELAAALGNDANFSATITTTLGVTNSFANGAFLRANAAYTAQNTTASFANGAFDRANSAASFANGAFAHANAAYAQANTGGGADAWARDQANAAFITANASYVAQNTTAIFANAAFDGANSAALFANVAFSHANAAFAQANTGSGDAWVRDQANAGFLQANSSYTAQNITASFANGAFDRANSAASFANGAFVTANSGASFANVAFSHANAAFAAANTGGGGSGSSVTVGSTPPSPAANGYLWYDDTTTGELFVYSSNSWVSTSIMPAIDVNDPVITGPNQANEATTQTYNISNYNGAYAYIISVTGGLVARTNNSIYWTLPSVTTNTTHYMTTQVVSDGVTSAVDTRTVLVVNLNIADAAVIVSDFSSTYANVTFGWA